MMPFRSLMFLLGFLVALPLEALCQLEQDQWVSMPQSATYRDQLLPYVPLQQPGVSVSLVGDSLWLATFQATDKKNAGMAVSYDQGRTWQAFHLPPGQTATGALMHRSGEGLVWIKTNIDQGEQADDLSVYHSQDSGRSWSMLPQFFRHQEVLTGLLPLSDTSYLAAINTQRSELNPYLPDGLPRTFRLRAQIARNLDLVQRSEFLPKESERLTFFARHHASTGNRFVGRKMVDDALYLKSTEKGPRITLNGGQSFFRVPQLLRPASAIGPVGEDQIFWLSGKRLYIIPRETLPKIFR